MGETRSRLIANYISLGAECVAEGHNLYAEASCTDEQWWDGTRKEFLEVQGEGYGEDVECDERGWCRRGFIKVRREESVTTLKTLTTTPTPTILVVSAHIFIRFPEFRYTYGRLTNRFAKRRRRVQMDTSVSNAAARLTAN